MSPRFVPVPTALAEVAHGRDHIKTSEFAHATCRATQTVLKNHCLTGECFGIRPIKRGKLLLWPVAEIALLLNGEETTRLTGKSPIKKSCNSRAECDVAQCGPESAHLTETGE